MKATVVVLLASLLAAEAKQRFPAKVSPDKKKVSPDVNKHRKTWCYSCLEVIIKVIFVIFVIGAHKSTLNSFLGHHINTIKEKTRSSWLNCALRDDEAVYWGSIGHYEAVAVSN